MPSTRTLRTAALALSALCLTGPLAGCRGDREAKPPREFFPDMDNSPKWKPQSESEFFADSRTMRLPVAGTVAFSRVALPPEVLDQRPDWAQTFVAQRDQLLKEDPRVFEGRDAAGAWVAAVPVAVDRALLLQGMEKYNITCAACHGYTGDGQGTVGRQWTYPVPSFHDPKYTDPAQQTGLDGYLYHVARVGVIGPDGLSKMPGYAHAMTEAESWGVVAYIRALQFTRKGTLQDLTEQEREVIERQWGGQASAATPNAGGRP
jgi:mono/diheme cytochrome c family protein